MRQASRYLAAIACAGAMVALALGLAVTAAPAGAARPRVPIVLGIHDNAINSCDGNQHQTTPPNAGELAAAVSSFNNPYWAALNVHTVRFSPPWDIAYHHDGRAGSKANKELAVIQTCFNAWLAGAARVGARPEIAFKPDPNFRARNRRFVGVPSIATYTKAIIAFTNTYSNPASTGALARVQIISPWGEPDFPGAIFMPAGGHTFSDPSCHGSPSVNTCGPILAAQMWVAVHTYCQQCTLLGQPAGSGVIGGDFSSLGGIRGSETGYLDLYRRHLNGLRPLVWGVHPYSDINGYEKAFAAGHPAPTNTLVAAFARELRRVGYHAKTQIWLNEISVFAGYDSHGHRMPSFTRRVQAAGGRYLLFGLPRAAGAANEPTVTRTYYYNYKAGNGPNSRWALVLGNGTKPQRIYTVFRQR